VLDTLGLARRMHPGQRNNLDALCKRYAVDNTHREYHGALLDARILAEVYLAMTGGQAHLTLGTQSDGRAQSERRDAAAAARRGVGRQIKVVLANETELELHAQALTRLDKASGGKTVWRIQ
jgi:DNA polymerase-3 subunit epsilon